MTGVNPNNFENFREQMKDEYIKEKARKKELADAFWIGWFTGWFFLLFTISIFYSRFVAHNTSENLFFLSQISLFASLIQIFIFLKLSHSTELLRSCVCSSVNTEQLKNCSQKLNETGENKDERKAIQS